MPPKNEAGENVYSHNSFPPIKIKMPQAFDRGQIQGQSIETYQEAFKFLLKKTDETYEKLATLNEKYTTLHPPFGYLNGNEWFQMNALHMKHHLRQIESLHAFLNR